MSSIIAKTKSLFGVCGGVTRPCLRGRWFHQSHCPILQLTPCQSTPPQHGREGTIYVHWPFCSQLCTYCNFNKYVRTFVDVEEMAKSLATEIKTRIMESSIRSVTSIYFGGGTPSLMTPSSVESVVNAVACCTHLDRDAEINLEANPTSTEIKKLRDFKMAGVTRLSLGIQAFKDKDLNLKILNRDHTVEEAKCALREAHIVFPGQVNIDVIFGRPYQTLENWTDELHEALSLCDNHISMYQLTVERGTPLMKSVKNGDIELPDDDTIADMYQEAIQISSQHNLERYEVSNFARKGYESSHNMSYWNGKDYLGIGPGAHSRYWKEQNDRFIHTVNVLEPSAWIKRVALGGHGVQLKKELTNKQRLEEVVATSLRTTSGLTHEIWQQFSLSTLCLNETFSSKHNDDLAKLLSTNLLAVDCRGLKATDEGMLVLDSIIPICIAALNKPCPDPIQRAFKSLHNRYMQN